MVKILATLKSHCAKACYLIQKLEPAFERVYLPQCFSNILFFIIGLAEDMKALKISVPYTYFFSCIWETKFLKPSYL